MEITTERTVLRILEQDDVSSEYVTWLNDPEINKYLELRFCKHTIESTRIFVQQVYEDPENYLFGIFVKGEHIGNIKLGPIISAHKRASLGLLIGRKEYWGQGVAVEVIKAVVGFAFSKLDLKKIDAGYYESHRASKKIFARAGFNVECFIPDHVIFNGRREGIYMLGIYSDQMADR